MVDLYPRQDMAFRYLGNSETVARTIRFGGLRQLVGKSISFNTNSLLLVGFGAETHASCP